MGIEQKIRTVRLTKAFFKMATPAGTDYISEIVQESFTPATDQDHIVFNKDFYKAKKEASSIC